MGCSSCGQKYRGLMTKKKVAIASAPQGAVLKKRIVKYYKGRQIVPNKPTLTGQGAQPAVTVSPDVVTSPSAPVPSYAVDPSTGFPVDVITKGECPENSLGEVRALPLDMTSESPAPQNSYGPSFGKTEKGEE